MTSLATFSAVNSASVQRACLEDSSGLLSRVWRREEVRVSERIDGFGFLGFIPGYCRRVLESMYLLVGYKWKALWGSWFGLQGGIWRG